MRAATVRGRVHCVSAVNCDLKDLIKPERPRSESRPHRVGVLLVSDRCWWQVAPGLGPPRSARHRKSGDCPSARTVDVESSRHRSPNGVAKRIPDWTAVGFRSPGPVPGFRLHLRARYQALGAAWVRRAGNRRALPSRAGTSLAATLTRLASDACAPISFGWPRDRRLSPRVACALRRRRWPPTPAVPAIPLLRTAFVRGSRTPYQEPFPFRRPISRPTTREIYAIPRKSVCFFDSRDRVIHRGAQVLSHTAQSWCIERWISCVERKLREIRARVFVRSVGRRRRIRDAPRRSRDRASAASSMNAGGAVRPSQPPETTAPRPQIG